MSDVNFTFRVFILGSMLIVGTAVTIASKCLLESKAVDGSVESGSSSMPHPFTYPWFLVLTMMIAEAFCLVIFCCIDFYKFLSEAMKRSFKTRQELRYQRLVGKPDLSEPLLIASPGSAVCGELITSPSTVDLLDDRKLNTRQILFSDEDKMHITEPDFGIRNDRNSMRSYMWACFIRCGFPAFCDLCATGLCTLGLVCVPISIFAMLRGTAIVCTAFFGYLILGKTYSYPRLFGLLLVMVAMGVVGYSGAKESDSNGSSGSESHNASSSSESSNGVANASTDASNGTNVPSDGNNGNIYLGMFLIAAAQLICGIQYAWMEKVLQDVKVEITPLLMVGLQGCTGTFLLLAVAYPFLLQEDLWGACNMVTNSFSHWWEIHVGSESYMTADGGADAIESSIESNVNTVVSNSEPNLWVFLTIYMFGIMLLNIIATNCTKYLTGVVTALVSNGLRTAVVWVTSLSIFYFTTHQDFGEPWHGFWSWVQAAGFTLYIVGMGIYMSMS